MAAALEIHSEAKGRQGINLDDGHILVHLGNLGLHVGLHGRIGGGIDADCHRIRARDALQIQRRLGRARVSHAKFRGKAEAAAVAWNQIAEADKERRRDPVEVCSADSQ